MGRPRLAALLTAAVLAASAARGQDGPAAEKEILKKAAKSFDKAPLPPDEAAALKKKLLLQCKKTGGCKSKVLEKEKTLKPGEETVFPGEVPAFEAPPPDGDPAVPPEGDPGAPAQGERAEALRRESGERRERAAGRALGAAEALRRSLAPAEEEAAEDGPGRPEAAAAPRGGWGGAESVQELALAEKTGYAAAFRAQGLKVGVGPGGEVAIQRLDGTPAGAAELGRLREVLRSEPEALRRRPDFYSVFSRARFSELKYEFAARPELRGTAFKHMALTEGGRDFQWSASCGPLSGDCNPVAEDQPYRKGQDVSPEDLEEVWEALDAEAEEDDEDWEEYTEEDRRLAAEEDRAAEKLASGRGFLPTLGGLLSRLGGLAGWTAEGAGPEAVGSAVGPGPGGRQAASGEREERSGGLGAAASGPGGSAGSTSGPRRGPPSAPGAGGGAARRGGLYVLFAAAAAGFIALGLRKKR